MAATSGTCAGDRVSSDGDPGAAAIAVVDMAATPLAREGDGCSRKDEPEVAAMPVVMEDMAALSLAREVEPRIAAMP